MRSARTLICALAVTVAVITGFLFACVWWTAKPASVHEDIAENEIYAVTNRFHRVHDEIMSAYEAWMVDTGKLKTNAPGGSGVDMNVQGVWLSEDELWKFIGWLATRAQLTEMFFVSNHFELLTNSGYGSYATIHDAANALGSNNNVRFGHADVYGPSVAVVEAPPKLKRPLVVVRSDSPNWFRCFIGSKEALELLKSMDKYYLRCPATDFHLVGPLPADMSLVVAPNYDFEEVWRYLTNSPLVTVQPK